MSFSLPGRVQPVLSSSPAQFTRLPWPTHACSSGPVLLAITVKSLIVAAGFWLSPYTTKTWDAWMEGNVYLKGSATIAVAGMDEKDLLGILGFKFELAKVEAQVLYNYASKPHVSPASKTAAKLTHNDSKLGVPHSGCRWQLTFTGPVLSRSIP